MNSNSTFASTNLGPHPTKAPTRRRERERVKDWMEFQQGDDATEDQRKRELAAEKASEAWDSARDRFRRNGPMMMGDFAIMTRAYSRLRNSSLRFKVVSVARPLGLIGARNRFAGAKKGLSLMGEVMISTLNQESVLFDYEDYSEVTRQPSPPTLSPTKGSTSPPHFSLDSNWEVDSDRSDKSNPISPEEISVTTPDSQDERGESVTNNWSLFCRAGWDDEEDEEDLKDEGDSEEDESDSAFFESPWMIQTASTIPSSSLESQRARPQLKIDWTKLTRISANIPSHIDEVSPLVRFRQPAFVPLTPIEEEGESVEDHGVGGVSSSRMMGYLREYGQV
ncbi:hypothetical protein IAR55_003157 [Kwoniella newhampshirensis]|uniref:Uncharacterized protein n=1 Tax=Kwoniella newhampshirensis TaxID=1651941 RepID=A0AAW0YPW0_9TREE